MSKFLNNRYFNTGPLLNNDTCIIIIITTNATDSNGLSALLGGYSGLMLGILFVMILNLVFTKITYLEMFPVLMVLIISGLLIFYLSKYFDKISKGEVSSYYSSFSLLSTIFLFTQLIIIFNSIFIGLYIFDKS